MLPATHRLKGRKEFNDLFQNGKVFSNDVLLMKIASGEAGKPSQFGFGASLKFSKKASERNKAKRWMREAVRAKIEEIQSGKNAIFLINPNFPKKELNLQLIQEKIENLFKKAKVL